METKVTKQKQIGFNLFGEPIIQDPLLRDRFLEPPFTVLDTKTASWGNRKRQWIALGIKSEIGRDGNLTYAPSAQSPGVYEFKNKLRVQWGREPSWDEIIEESNKQGINLMPGTSIFCPALTELIYRWFCPDKVPVYRCKKCGHEIDKEEPQKK